MTSQKRRIVAYLAGRIISGKNPSGIFDRASSSWTSVSVVTAPNHLSVYDHDRACMISVVGPPKDLYVYDAGSGRHIQLKINGCNFSGYDFETQAFFSGNVTGTSVFFCDFQHSDFFKYSTQPAPRPSPPRVATPK